MTKLTALQAQTQVRATRNTGLLARIWRYRWCYVALLPTFLMLGIFKYFPMFSALYHSLFDWDGYRVERWIGLDNFKTMFGDEIFMTALHNMIIIAAVHTAVQIIMPLIGAELIFNLRNSAARYFYRVLFVIPLIVPGLVILLIWGFIYTPQLGLLNQILRATGLDMLTHAWLGDPATALGAIIAIGFPWVGGISLLIYLAGLQNISEETLEAAALDGATGLRRVISVDLPLILGQVRIIAILAIINNIRGFGEVLILTDGGPGYSTMVPGLYMYQSAFSYGRMGYASAIGTFLFMLILLLTFLNLRFVRPSLEEEGR